MTNRVCNEAGNILPKYFSRADISLQFLKVSPLSHTYYIARFATVQANVLAYYYNSCVFIFAPNINLILLS